MDGDLQHPPSAIKRIYSKLKDNDLVIAKRTKVIDEWPIHRKIISKIATIFAKLRLSNSVNDPMSGYFGFKTEIIRGVIDKHFDKFELEGYKILFDILKYSGDIRVAEVGYTFGSRTYGASKLGNKQMYQFFRSLFK